MMEQMNILDSCLMSITSYPKMKDIKISKAQLMFIVNALQVYEFNLKKIDRKDLLENTKFQFHKDRELREIKVLVKYLEDVINGGNKKNKNINKHYEKDEVLEGFSWLRE